MQTIGMTFDASTTAAGIGFASRIWRQPMRELLRLLDCLVPPSAARGADLPPEFFRCPPV